MTVPSQRMLWLWSFLGIPLCVAAVFVPAVWSLLFVFVALTVTDGYRGRDVKRALSVGTEESVSVTRGRDRVVSLRVANTSNRRLKVRIAPVFPAVLEAVPPTMLSTLLPPRSEFTWSLTLRARERGKWPIEAYSYEAESPWGLWQVRGQNRLSLSVHVYPNLAANKTAVLLIHRQMSGLKAYRQVGNGREFEKLREYAPGDTYDQIYWKASAKRARPMTKVFQAERAQPCYVLVDCSRQTAKSLDAFVEAALVLGLAADRFGDQFGVLTFSDRVHSFEAARAGKKQFGRCRNALYALRTRPVSADYAELSRFLQTNVRKRALLFLLTSLDDPYGAETLAMHIRLLALRHVIVVGALRQDRVQPIFEGPEPDSVSDIYGALAGHLAWTKLREAGRRIELMGVRLAMCDARTIYEDLTNRYREIHQRQLV